MLIRSDAYSDQWLLSSWINRSQFLVADRLTIIGLPVLTIELKLRRDRVDVQCPSAAIVLVLNIIR